MFVKITRQTFVRGQVVFPGQVIDVTEKESYNLLPGKAVKANEAEVKAAKADAEKKAKEEAEKKGQGGR